MLWLHTEHTEGGLHLEEDSEKRRKVPEQEPYSAQLERSCYRYL